MVSLCHEGKTSPAALRRNLYALHIDDKTIQAILRHSSLRLTMNVYVKMVSGSQTAARDSLSKKFGNVQQNAAPAKGPVN